LGLTEDGVYPQVVIIDKWMERGTVSDSKFHGKKMIGCMYNNNPLVNKQFAIENGHL
jgi:hypothetical protein